MITKTKNIGTVMSMQDGIIIADGLSKAGYNELVSIKTKKGILYGLVLDLEQESVSIIVLGDYLNVKEGDEVEAIQKPLTIRVDNKIFGNIINPLGYLINDSSILACPNGNEMPFEYEAPNIIARKNVFRPLYTGTLCVDSVIPVGLGQRELIIGDRTTGKASFCLDTVINQKGKNVKCVYVAIGQKESKVAQIKSKLSEYGALDYTVIVAAGASDPVSLQYVAPYSGCAIAEYFAQKGEDILIIFDDLTQHAWAYRQISLLLKRPAGREAYPGDIFYLHSRLLERALQYSDNNGGGSITALPIIETLSGDISAYIPTNVISITDGQIYFDNELFNLDQKPAVNIGTSVSRVGSSSQILPMKQFSGSLKLDLAQYRELEAFSQFGSELDKDTQYKLKKGAVLMEVLKQDQYHPYKVEEEVFLLLLAAKDLLIDIKLDQISNVLKKLLRSSNDIITELSSYCKLNQKIPEDDISKITAKISNKIKEIV